MEYERIDKVQTGVISPSKLRLKLLGPHNHKRKEGGSNSSRTSPSKLEELEYSRSSLLADSNNELDYDGGSRNVDGPSAFVSTNSKENQSSTHSKQTEGQSTGNKGRIDVLTKSKGGGHQIHINNNLSSVHPMRSLEEDKSDYDSGHDNASSSSFEFHKGARTLHNSILGPFSRPIPSKWNDAEKWVLNRHGVQQTWAKKIASQSQVSSQSMTNSVRATPEVAVLEQRPNVMVVTDADIRNPTSQGGLKKHSPVVLQPLDSASGIDGIAYENLSDQCDDLNQADITSIPAMRSVAMRDTGTEMTPMTSLEPSRTGTPVGSTTPIRSPTSSIPSTPRNGEPAPTPAEAGTDVSAAIPGECNGRELSEKELQIKTRKEIVALGIQLGKMNIAAWASKEDGQNNGKAAPEPSLGTPDSEKLQKLEFENRAAAWEEAEKSKHNARLKREEIKIQAWESHQKAKLEAEMKRIEAQVQQMKAQAQEKMLDKLATMQQRSEEKRALAEARKNQQAAKTAQQAEYIRHTGRIPTTHFLCCGCFY